MSKKVQSKDEMYQSLRRQLELAYWSGSELGHELYVKDPVRFESQRICTNGNAYGVGYLIGRAADKCITASSLASTKTQDARHEARLKLAAAIVYLAAAMVQLDDPSEEKDEGSAPKDEGSAPKDEGSAPKDEGSAPKETGNP